MQLRIVQASVLAAVMFAASLLVPQPPVLADTPASTGTVPPAQSGGSTTPATPQFPPPPAPPAAPAVRVGLDHSLTTLSLSADGGLYVVVQGAVVAQSQPGQTLNITQVADKLQIDGLPAPVAGPVRFVPVPPKDPAVPNYLAYKKRTYRGEAEILIAPKDQKLSVVNVVNLEDYLQGVVPREMGYAWPQEALKAQAVAARNYALTHLGKWSEYGYDLSSTTLDQDYGGVPAETPATNNAVRATAGKVLTFQGKLASTYFFSSSGGHTENSEIIWGGFLGYLRGVPDFDNVPANRYYSWRYSFDLPRFLQLVKAYKGQDVGNLTGVSPTGAMGVSGRPSAWLVAGSAKSVTLRAEELRDMLDLPSSAKQITVQITTVPQTPAPGPASVSVMGADRRVIERPLAGASVMGANQAAATVSAAQVTVVGASRTPVAIQTAATAVQAAQAAQQTGSVEVIGGGFGHAVGLSQFGSYTLAILGRTYDQILTYYYTGTKVETR